MSIVGLLIYVLVAAIVLWLLYMIIANVVPTEMQRMAKVVLMVIAGIFLIYILLQFAGGSATSLPKVR